MKKKIWTEEELAGKTLLDIDSGQTRFIYKAGFTPADVVATLRAKNNGTRAATATNACVYETANGNHCAVGCFIPKGHVAMESNLTAQAVMKAYPDLVPRMPFGPMGMRAMQKVHDSAEVGQNINELLEMFLRQRCRQPSEVLSLTDMADWAVVDV